MQLPWTTNSANPLTRQHASYCLGVSYETTVPTTIRLPYLLGRQALTCCSVGQLPVPLSVCSYMRSTYSLPDIVSVWEGYTPKNTWDSLAALSTGVSLIPMQVLTKVLVVRTVLNQPL